MQLLPEFSHVGIDFSEARKYWISASVVIPESSPIVDPHLVAAPLVAQGLSEESLPLKGENSAIGNSFRRKIGSKYLKILVVGIS